MSPITNPPPYIGHQARHRDGGSDVLVAAVRKTADETVANSTVLQDDDQLLFAIGANESWTFTFMTLAIEDGIGTPGIHYAVTAPAGATGNVSVLAGSSITSSVARATSTGQLALLTSDLAYLVIGTVVNGGTAGNVTLQWAQFLAAAAATRVKAGSYVEAFLV